MFPLTDCDSLKLSVNLAKIIDTIVYRFVRQSLSCQQRHEYLAAVTVLQLGLGYVRKKSKTLKTFRIFFTFFAKKTNKIKNRVKIFFLQFLAGDG